MKNKAIFSKSIYALILSMFFFNSIAQQEAVSYDTVIVFDPVTYEETIRVVKTEGNISTASQPGDECYTFVLGSQKFDLARTTAYNLSRESVIDNFNQGFSAKAKDGCDDARRLSNYNLKVRATDGSISTYSYNEMQQVQAKPEMYQRIFFAAEAVMIEDIEVLSMEGKRLGLSAITIKIAE